MASKSMASGIAQTGGSSRKSICVRQNPCRQEVIPDMAGSEISDGDTGGVRKCPMTVYETSVVQYGSQICPRATSWASRVQCSG